MAHIVQILVEANDQFLLHASDAMVTQGAKAPAYAIYPVSEECSTPNTNVSGINLYMIMFYKTIYNAL